MQNMEAMHGISPSPSAYVVNTISDGNQAVLGWPQQYAAQTSMEQAVNNAYVMNVIKPEQQQQVRARMEQQQQQQAASTAAAAAAAAAAAGAAAQANPSVITATYNPTYNRCLPKILSDLDCEMKIKQVLKCIENILLDGNELDQHQSYKLPDRSSSPQLKRAKKEDEEMMAVQSLNHSAAGVSTNKSSSSSATSTPKNPVRINVKVEPSETSTAEKAHRTLLGMYQTEQPHQVPGSGSPAAARSQVYDINSTNRLLQHQPAAAFSKAAATAAPARAFSFEQPAFNFAAANAQFVQQFTPQQQQQLQAQQTQLLMQHITQQQMHQQLQQQLLNSGIHVLPQLNNMALQQLQFPSAASPQAQSHAAAQQALAAHVPQFHEHVQQAQQAGQVPDNAFASVQMDEFPFPVFSNTILEEVSQFKPTRDEQKKEGEETAYFFGNHPSGQNPLYFNVQASAPQSEQAATAAAQAGGTTDGGASQPQPQDQQQRTPNPLGASLSQLHPFLFQMPQLTGLPGVLEEDDKWILSLLNIDGHENNAGALATAPASL